ncbi:hypothetical protein ACQ4PT_051110 [Festuca glaucescens]
MAAGQSYHYAKLKITYGGKMERSSQGGQPKYNGGDNKLIKVPRSISLPEFHDRLAVLASCLNVAIQYISPSDTQHALRDVVTDADLRQLLDWALLRDLQMNLRGARTSNEFVSHVRVFVLPVASDVPPPLPESLFSSAPTTETTPAPPPSCLNKRSASAPSLSTNPADDTSNPPSPSVFQRSASASTSTQPSTEDDTTTSITATGVPVVPVLVYQPVFQVCQGVVVSSGYLAWFSSAPLKTD